MAPLKWQKGGKACKTTRDEFSGRVSEGFRGVPYQPKKTESEAPRRKVAHRRSRMAAQLLFLPATAHCIAVSAIRSAPIYDCCYNATHPSQQRQMSHLPRRTNISNGFSRHPQDVFLRRTHSSEPVGGPPASLSPKRLWGL